VADLLFDILNLSRRVTVSVSVGHSSSPFLLISSVGVLAFSNVLVNPSLSISAFQVLDVKQELHCASCLARHIGVHVLVSDNKDRVELVFDAVFEHGIEVSFKLVNLEVHEPVPPVRVSLVNVKWKFGRVGHGIDELCVGWENIQRVADAAEDFVTHKV